MSTPPIPQVKIQLKDQTFFPSRPQFPISETHRQDLKPINLSHCFICAALGKAPLRVAVLLPKRFNCINPTPTPPGPSPSLHNISLFTDPLNHQFPFCYSTPNSSLCNVTLSNVTSHHAPIGSCLGAMAPFLSLSIPLPLSVCLSPWFHD